MNHDDGIFTKNIKSVDLNWNFPKGPKNSPTTSVSAISLHSMNFVVNTKQLSCLLSLFDNLLEAHDANLIKLTIFSKSMLIRTTDVKMFKRRKKKLRKFRITIDFFHEFSCAILFSCLDNNN